MTALFPWNNQYRVGIPEIDRQHQQLFDIANAYFEQREKQQSPELDGQLLKDLLDYAHQHFNYEEDLLRKNGYPYYAEHVQEHLDFFAQLTSFSRATSGELDLRAGVKARDVAKFLMEWLTHHIVEVDFKYAAYLVKEDTA